MKDVAFLPIPEYYHADRYLEKRLDAVPASRKRFLFVTDVHWDQFNAQYSPALIAHVCRHLEPSAVLNGGDVVEIQPDKHLGLEVIGEYTACMLAAVGKVPYLPVLGNHDLNTANVSKRYGPEAEAVYGIPYASLYQTMLAHCREYIHTDPAYFLDTLPITEEEKRELHAYMKLHYYFDDPVAGIRYIHLVTGTGDNGMIKPLFGIWGSQELLLQFDWLYETLLSTPSGYDVVLSGHRIITWTSTPHLDEDQVKGYALNVCEMLTAAKTKRAMCVGNSIENALLNLCYARGTHAYDFAAMPDIGKILVLCGDMHWDHFCVTHYDQSGNYISETAKPEMGLASGEIPVICTQADGYRGAHYPDMPYGNKFYPVQKDSIAEQCFDIVSMEDDRITLVRIGPGKDRVIRYR